MTDGPTPTAGWYPHPSQPGAQRYWDGQQWTDHVQPAQQPQHSPTQPPKTNVLGIIALVAAIIGFVFACIPGALVIGWVLLPIAFILSLVALFQSGSKWQAITGLSLSIVGTIVAFVVFLVVVADVVDEAVDEAFDGGDSEYAVTVDGTRQVKDYEGKPALLVDFTFTNNGDDDANYLFAATARASQNGVELDDAFLTGSESENALKDIKPGTSIAVQEAFVLDDATDVTIEVTDAFGFDDNVLVTKTVQVKAGSDETFGEAHSEYEVTIDGSRQSQDYEGEPALLVDFTFTNNGDNDESFIFSVSAKAFQNGVELEDAYLMDSDPGNALKDIKPGKSIAVQEAFVLDDTSDVTIEVTEAISLDDTVLVTKTIRIK